MTDLKYMTFDEEDIPTVKQMLAVLMNKSHMMTQTQKDQLWIMYGKLKEGKMPTDAMMDHWRKFLTVEDESKKKGYDLTDKDIKIASLEERVTELEERQRYMEKEVAEHIAAVYDVLLNQKGKESNWDK